MATRSMLPLLPVPRCRSTSSKTCLILICTVFLSCSAFNSTRRCGPCRLSACPPQSIGNCGAGTTLDQCGCCVICRRTEGQSCGTNSSSLGVCAAGLACVNGSGQNGGESGVCRPQKEVSRGCTFTNGLVFDRCNRYHCSPQGILQSRPLSCSELRCHGAGKAEPCCSKCKLNVSVDCEVDHLIVAISLDSMGDLVFSNFTFLDPKCRPLFNSTHALFRSSYNSCGTTSSFDKARSTMLYRNTITTSSLRSPLKDYKNKLSIEVSCRFNYFRAKSETLYHVVEEQIAGGARLWLTTEGGKKLKKIRTFHVGSRLNFVAVVVRRLEKYGLKVAVQSCYLSRARKTHRLRQLIDNGCPVENSVKILRTFNSGMWFSFRSQRGRNSIPLTSYLHCSVVLCHVKETRGLCGLEKCQKTNSLSLSNIT